jgi:catechol 2,3-dioxygenase-like lactoylglutathione lyase family enzyme
MNQIVSHMLEGYESGRITRRQLIQALTALATTPPPPPRAAASTFRGVGLNHIAIRAANVQRSRNFYQKHFGLPVLHESQSNCFLGPGKNFLTIFQNPNPGLDHFCSAIEHFNADGAMDELKRQGLNPTRPAGSDRVYFPDPDGLTVQLSSVDHHA